MDPLESSDLSVPDNILDPLLVASSAPTLTDALDCLTKTARTADGQLELASKRIPVSIVELCRYLSFPLRRDLLVSSLRLLRNLCAGEISNQNMFVEENGAGVLSEIVESLGLPSDSENVIVRTVLQVLANVSLAGEEHQLGIWHQFFPSRFLKIARIRSKETCDPLCMVIYTCSAGSNELYAELLGDSGLEIVLEIVQTSAAAGFTEDWLKLLLSRICLEGSCFWSIFSRSSLVVAVNNCDTPSIVTDFGLEHAFLLSVLSEILNEQIGNIALSRDFALCILGILRTAVTIVGFSTKANSNLPTGCANIDVMGYSLTILRDICAGDWPKFSAQDEEACPVDVLVSDGLIELLLTLLRDLEPPPIIRKAAAQSEANDGKTSHSSKYCPYKGLRRDIVPIIGNCCYRRKYVQDKIRELDGIVLLLQQCVTDEENPFLREWGIWMARNLLEGNVENTKFVASLELQGSMDAPELTQMGLRVEVDPKTQRAKLVNRY